MAEKHEVDLGEVQQTLLIPLYGRALETGKRRAVLRDPKAVEMVAAIDYDFAQLDDSRILFGCVVRTAIFDCAARAFLAEHPAGTVVEIGAGLNTRFERVDNGTLRWVDVDLPDVVTLRRRFFADSGRRRMVAASVLDPGWVEAVSASPGPYLFLVEAVLLYLPEPQVKQALSLIAEQFPGARMVLDTAGRRMVESQRRSKLATSVSALFRWACDDPTTLERWGLGIRLVDSYRFAQPPRELRPMLPLGFRCVMPLAALFSRGVESYRFNTIEFGPASL